MAGETSQEGQKLVPEDMMMITTSGGCLLEVGSLGETCLLGIPSFVSTLRKDRKVPLRRNISGRQLRAI